MQSQKSFTLTSVLKKLDSVFIERADKNGDVIFLFAIQEAFKQMRMYDDTTFYSDEIIAVPLKRDPRSDDKKITGEELVARFKCEKLYQLWIYKADFGSGLILPEHLARAYDGSVEQYNPLPVMYVSQTTD